MCPCASETSVAACVGTLSMMSLASLATIFRALRERHCRCTMRAASVRVYVDATDSRSWPPTSRIGLRQVDVSVFCGRAGAEGRALLAGASVWRGEVC